MKTPNKAKARKRWRRLKVGDKRPRGYQWRVKSPEGNAPWTSAYTKPLVGVVVEANHLVGTDYRAPVLTGRKGRK